MERRLMNDLISWQGSRNRKPLMLEGVRQSGKTWLLKRFGADRFPGTAYFNFESDASLAAVFEGDLDPKRILKALSQVSRLPLLDGKCLVVLDEVQNCGRALTSLKYFQEEMPGFPIAVAGSLLGVLTAKPMSYPVGKVDILRLRPMDFEECLAAAGEAEDRDFLRSLRFGDRVPEPVARRLLERLDAYLLHGGMPEAVRTWLETADPERTDAVLETILSLYERDFAKHAPTTDIPRLGLVWDSLPAQLARPGGRFRYKDVKEGARAREYENALQWLRDAGLVHRVQGIAKPVLPLKAYADATRFKLFCQDVGILRKLARVPAWVPGKGPGPMQEFKGALWENLFLQEYVAHTGEPAYFWESGNLAEIDFVVQSGTRIVPVEVKSADNVRSKSLSVYREKYAPPVCVRVSRKGFGFENGILSLPPYMLSRFVDLTQ